MADKKILFLKMTSDYTNTAKVIKQVSELYNLKFIEFEIESVKQLRRYLDAQETVYDYIYIAAHGNEKGILACDKQKDIIRYADLGLDLCGSEALSQETVIYIGCCKGGFKRGSLAMMVNCDKISTICGIECDVSEYDAAVAFNNFLYLTNAGATSSDISNRISNVLQKKFSVYSKQEHEVDIMVLSERVYGIDILYLPSEDYAPSYRIEESNKAKLKKAA